jgi:hypothetical protein
MLRILIAILFLFEFVKLLSQSFKLLNHLEEMDSIRASYKNESIDLSNRDYILKVIKKADEAIDIAPPSVMMKKEVAASGDKHDYLSLAPYFWPDPSKKDSIPYMRRDGEVNPMTRKAGDYVYKETLFKGLKNLCWAFYFTKDNVYSRQANKMISVWFVNKETKMNPHLKYGQAVTGENSGRPAGLIEMGGFNEVLQALQILDREDGLSKENKVGLTLWFSQYLKWLESDPIALKEDKAKNNHGTWFDVQIIAIQQYLGNIEDAKKRLSKITKRRITQQIRLDGTMPEELGRTKSWNYTCMNLDAFLTLVDKANKYGIDLYNYSDSKSGSIGKALLFIKPYMEGKTWPYKQIEKMDMAKGRSLFTKAAFFFNDKAAQKFIGDANEKPISLSLYLD